MVITESDIVVSLNGRDSGKYFFVIGIEDEYALIADGKGRRIENPKRKKLKHIKLASRKETCVTGKIRNGEKITNSDLRRTLAEFSASGIEDRGGM